MVSSQLPALLDRNSTQGNNPLSISAWRWQVLDAGFLYDDFLFVFNNVSNHLLMFLLKYDKVIWLPKAQVSWLLANTLTQVHA